PISAPPSAATCYAAYPVEYGKLLHIPVNLDFPEMFTFAVFQTSGSSFDLLFRYNFLKRFLEHHKVFINSLRLHRSFYGGLADQLCVTELAAAEGRPCWNGEDVVKSCAAPEAYCRDASVSSESVELGHNISCDLTPDCSQLLSMMHVLLEM
ncbi:hypothetical protein STEG23_033112, partial [Scotinomys teguina]